MTKNARKQVSRLHRRGALVFLALALVGLGWSAAAKRLDAAHAERARSTLVAPWPGAAQSHGWRGLLAGNPLDVNRAGVSDFDALPGVGKRTAGALVDEREARGGFGAVEELEQAAGIGPAKWEQLAPWVTVRVETRLARAGALVEGE